MSQKAQMTCKQLRKALLDLTFYSDVEYDSVLELTEALEVNKCTVNVEIEQLGNQLTDEDLIDDPLGLIMGDLVKQEVQQESHVNTVLHAIRIKGLTYEEAFRQVNNYYNETPSGSDEEDLAENVRVTLREQRSSVLEKLEKLTLKQLSDIANR